jgi:FSR family fosmidomycin resistance protein-like MFS transporter
LVRISAAVMTVFYIAWLLAPGPWAKIILILVVRMGTLGWYPVLQGEAYASARGKSGTVMALTSLAGPIAGALTWLVGWVAGRAGLPAAMWVLLAGPISLLIFMPRPERKK